MKDLFRQAGAIIRADVAFFPDGRPKGTGIVVYENHEDAKNAICKCYDHDHRGGGANLAWCSDVQRFQLAGVCPSSSACEYLEAAAPCADTDKLSNLRTDSLELLGSEAVVVDSLLEVPSAVVEPSPEHEAVSVPAVRLVAAGGTLRLTSMLTTTVPSHTPMAAVEELRLCRWEGSSSRPSRSWLGM